MKIAPYSLVLLAVAGCSSPAPTNPAPMPLVPTPTPAMAPPPPFTPAPTVTPTVTLSPMAQPMPTSSRASVAASIEGLCDQAQSAQGAAQLRPIANDIEFMADAAGRDMATVQRGGTPAQIQDATEFYLALSDLKSAADLKLIGGDAIPFLSSARARARNMATR